jgi:zinc protease
MLLPALLVLGTVSLASAQAPGPLDPSIKTGTLDNGVRYFLLKNAKPENRVELRLSVQAGSVQETDAQRGLAHLVEHLQFEGTDRFGPQEIVGFLESNGMKFGNDLNAQTNFTDTQYFLDLPADKPEVLVKGLQILEDWAHGPQVTPELLEKEKKIVAEEERVRMENVQGRVTKFFMPVLLDGTAYGDRLPIGDMAVLKAITPADVDRFVQKWYTAPALSLQIVGDFDPTAMEALVKKTVAKPFPTAAAPAPQAPEVPPYTAASLHTFQDAEMGANVLVWNKVLPVDPSDVAVSKQLDLLNFVVSFTLSKRFTELTQTADPPFLQASVGASALFGKAWLSQFQLVVRDGVAERSVETYLTELKRLALHGLTATDLQLALGEYRSIVENQYVQRANTTNTQRGTTLAAHALTGDPLLSDDDDYRLKKATADQITLASVNAVLPSWLDLNTTRLLVLTTGKAEAGVPDEAGLKAIEAKVAASVVAQSQERTVKPLFTAAPQPGKVAKAEKVAGTPLTKWTLSNGLVVWIYPNTFTKNEIQLKAIALGGLSRVADPAYLAAAFSPYLFGNTGLGDLSLPELTDFLTGHQANASAGVDDTSATLSGSSVPADLEVLFQLVNKKLTAPRRDPAAETSFLKQVEQSLKNQQDLPQQLYQNEIQRVLNGGAPRSQPITADRIGEIAPERAAQAYVDFFQGGAGMTFTITGDVDEDTLKPLVETYLASISTAKASPLKDLGIRPLKGPLTSVVKKGQDNKAVVTVFLPVTTAYSTTARLTAAALQEILDIRLREVVRQDKEGTYGVSVDVTLSPYPYAHALTQVNFTCDKARQDELLAAVVGELKALAAGKIDDEVFHKAIEIRKKGLETDQKVNGWWTWAVSSALYQGDDLKALSTLPAFYSALKKSDVAAQAKALLDPSKALTVILNPEDKK